MALPETPVIIARNLGRPGQEVTIKPLEQLTAGDADMRTILLVGSHQTRTIQRSDGRIYTPRRYAESECSGDVGIRQDLLMACGTGQVTPDGTSIKWNVERVCRARPDHPMGASGAR